MKQIFTLCLLAVIGVANVNAQTITTYATVATPAGLVFDGTGNLYVVQYAATGNVMMVNTSGVATTFSQSSLNYPSSIVTDGSGNFYANRSGATQALTYKINSTGVVSTYSNLLGSVTPFSVAIDASGNVFTLISSGYISKKTLGVSGTTIFGPGLNTVSSPAGMAFDAAGNLYVGYNSIIYKITSAGVVSTFATLLVSNINSLAIDAAGNIFLGGSFSGIYKVTPTGTVSAVAGLNSLSNIYGLAFDASGNLLASGYSTNTIYKISSSALPVKLVAFSATSTNNAVGINWQSTNEINLSHYTIQRSVDGTTFNNIGKVAAKGDGSYTLADNQLPSAATIYYRLQMVDKDGSFTYSKVVSCKMTDATKALAIYPNPVKDNLFVQITSTKAEKLTLQVTDLQGKILQQEDTQIGVGNVSLSVNTATLPKGSYVILVKGSTMLQQKQFVKE